MHAFLLKQNIQSSHIAFNAIRLVICRFPGPIKDAQCYQTLQRIGRSMARDLPRRARLIADGGYPARVPLIVPRRIVHNRRQRLANRRLRSIRVQIEYSIGFQNVYACISSVFRHKRLFLPFVVSTCGFLSTEETFFCLAQDNRYNLTTFGFTPHVQHNCTSITSMLKK